MSWGGGGSFLTRVQPIPVEVRNPAQPRPQGSGLTPGLDHPPTPAEQKREVFLPRTRKPPAPKFTKPPEGWPPLPDESYTVGSQSGKVYRCKNEVKPCPKCNKVYVTLGASGCNPCAVLDGTKKRGALKRKRRAR